MSSIINDNKILLNNPISGKKIGELNICSESDFSSIVKNASEYAVWRELPLTKRCGYIHKFRKI